MGTYLRTHPEEKITLSVQPNGVLVATGASNTFNRDHVGSINANLSAYANLNGVSTKEAAKAFYGEFYKDVLTTPNNTSSKVVSNNNPLNLKSASSNSFRKFDTLEEGIVAADKQLLRYAEGVGVAGGKPRKTVKDIIDLWRPASDIRKNDISQKDYIDYVSKAMGVSYLTQLDLKDKLTASRLIAAMSNIEGNPVDPDRVFKTLPDRGQSPLINTIETGNPAVSKVVKPISSLEELGVKK
jgi:hypothetical protein